jgi:hypothetical protein
MGIHSSACFTNLVYLSSSWTLTAPNLAVLMRARTLKYARTRGTAAACTAVKDDTNTAFSAIRIPIAGEYSTTGHVTSALALASAVRKTVAVGVAVSLTVLETDGAVSTHGAGFFLCQG